MKNPEESQENFNQQFTRWVEQYQPSGDTSALRAVAWFWWSHGHDEAIIEFAGDSRMRVQDLSSTTLTDRGFSAF